MAYKILYVAFSVCVYTYFVKLAWGRTFHLFDRKKMVVVLVPL